jgi:hypothetical protein
LSCLVQSRGPHFDHISYHSPILLPLGDSITTILSLKCYFDSRGNHFILMPHFLCFNG